MQDFLATLEGEKKSTCVEDNDCVILDGDPDKALLAVVKVEKKLGGSEEELQVLGEQGEVRPAAHLQVGQNRVSQLQAAQNRAAHHQVAQNRAAARQALQYAARTAHRAQDPSAIQKSWQVVLANLASNLGVSDYNINPPQVQHSVSVQSLQQSQLLAQAKASQGERGSAGNTPATAQMRPSSIGLRKSGNGDVATLKT